VISVNKVFRIKSMNNTIVIFRPYLSIKRSVSILSPKDTFVVGKFKTFKVIRSILGRLNLIHYQDNVIDRNDSAQYYFNNGNPYLGDLLEYYQHSFERWRVNNGDIYDYLSDYYTVIRNSGFHKNYSNWTLAACKKHRQFLIRYNKNYKASITLDSVSRQERPEH